MLDRLRARQKAGVEGRGSLVFLHDLLALFDEADDRVAGLPLRLGVDHLEHLFQPFDVGFGFALVLLEGGAQFLGLRGLGHLGKRGEDLLLGEIDVLQGVVEQRVELLGLLGHVGPPVGNRGLNAARARQVPCG